MKLKGSSKKTFSLAFALLIGLMLTRDEGIDLFGSKYILFTFVTPLIVLIIDSLFDRKESIELDEQKIYFDLRRYSCSINISDIKSISLADNANDLILETESTSQTYKLYGFKRKEILQFIALIDTKY